MCFTALHCRNLKEEGKPWFSTVPIGKNSLDRYVKDMCLVAGIEGKTKQSLRASGTTRTYRQGILKRLFNLRADIDIEALHTYECVSSDQERSMCNVLAGVTNQLLPAGQAACSAGMTQLNSAFNVSGYTVNIYNAPVSIGESSTVTNGNYHLSVKNIPGFVLR